MDSEKKCTKKQGKQGINRIGQRVYPFEIIGLGFEKRAKTVM